MKRALPFVAGWIVAWLAWRFLSARPGLLSWIDVLGVPPLRSLLLILAVFGAGCLCLGAVRRLVR